MRIVIAGGHGQIARRLAHQLSTRGHTVVGLIRNPDQAPAVEQAGAKPVMADLASITADELAALLGPADAVVFAAGAGPGSGIERKDTIDRAAAVLLADAAQRQGIRRYLLVSSMGVEDPERADDPTFRAYLQAKLSAEHAVRDHDLDWTILRPGRLTDEPGTGHVRLARTVGSGAISRDDLASVLRALLDTPDTAGHVLEVVAGDAAIDQAVQAIVSSY